MKPYMFKEWLLWEAKKKEPTFEPGRELGRLRDMQQYLIRKELRHQLFVPKRRDPKVMAARATSNRLNATAREITEEAPPILTGYNEAPPGSNKPGTGFWTSSAIKKDDAYTSEWYEYVKNNHKDWQTDYGYLFEIDSRACVFDLAHAQQFYEWAIDHGRMKMNKLDYAREYSDDDMRLRFPWDQLSRHFDGAYAFPHGGHNFHYGWDVESTVWFDTKCLKYKGAVKLWHGMDDFE